MHTRGTIVAVILLSAGVYAFFGSLFPEAPLNGAEVMLVTLLVGALVVGLQMLVSRVRPRRDREKLS